MTEEDPQKDLVSHSLALNGSTTGFGHAVALIAVNSFTSILGSLGNILVCATVYKTPSLRNNFGYFICSLALADFLVTFIVQPLIVFFVIRYDIQHHDVPMTVHLATEILTVTSCGASMGSLFFLSVDRCLCIVFPVRYRTLVTRRRVKIIIASVWLQACTSLVRYFCSGFIPPEAFRVFAFTYFLVCYCVICGCYASVFWKIRKQARFRRKMHLGISGRRRVFVAATRRENPSRDGSSVMEKKLARMIAVVVGVFTVAWAPLGFVFASKNDFSQTVILWAVTTGLCSSSVNPIIYCYGSQECRSACWKLLTRCCRPIGTKRKGGTTKVTSILK